ncbi:copper resistance CopC family protein [Homoserinibacter gongjuensis]|uniref:CopC domain-containing protein n=1 Tax=Homoserinibacter gongjuensis TaxID=1162968 RepID=A0ABQ6JMR8_9MICO|nr:copper resistance CopC family protein [Homoserinibacter gongjuensis]GMA89548.1 hypothetical protein GCM10025869_00770 [Homoserinibacter gongjuensis]
MRRVLRALAVGTAAAALVLFAAVPASAHSQLVGSTPAEGETLAELPAEFSVTMNERLLDDAGLSAFALRVRDAGGLYYGDGCLQVADDTMSTAAAIGPAGDYVLEWQVVSADGHPVGARSRSAGRARRRPKAPLPRRAAGPRCRRRTRAPHPGTTRRSRLRSRSATSCGSWPRCSWSRSP